MRRWTLLMAACCLLSACASGPTPMPAVAAPRRLEVQPPPNLTQPPATLPPPASGRMRDLEANHLQVAQTYHDLAIRYCRLLLFLQQWHAADGCRPWLTDPMDEAHFEHAARIEQAARDAAAQQASKALAGPGQAECEDCGIEIPAARRAANPAAIRCVHCQTAHERSRAAFTSNR